MHVKANPQYEQALKSGWFANSLYTALKQDILALYNTSAWMKFYAWFRWCVSPYYEVVENLPERGHIVDMGCGFGLLTAAASLVHPHAQYTGLDADERRTSAAAQCLKPINAEIAFHAVDWYTFPLADVAAFTFVDVLHHLPPDEQRRVLAYCAEKLSPNGYILIKDVGTTPAWKYWANFFFDLSTRLTSVTMSEKPFYRSAEDWMALGTSLGLRVEQISLQHKDYAAHILIKLHKT
jgi:2-polyprenyl-3-methyl-5-hydroxy-6-metoxy-1,4-benzoquinol methylase